MELSEKQKGVVRGVIPAALITVITLCGLSWFTPVGLLPLDEPSARLAWALQWTLLPMLALMISIMGGANYGFASPADIDGSGLTAERKRGAWLGAIFI